MLSISYELAIDPDGALRFVYADALEPMTELGDCTIRRASHVEPVGTQWQADLSPVGGPILGLYALRQQALDAEVAWLSANWL